MSSELASVGKPGGPGSKAGLFIWRIENKICVPVDPKVHGQVTRTKLIFFLK
jgi:hypothetical protein